MNNLQTLSSFFMFLSAIYNILLSFTIFVKNCNILWAKNLFQYNKNHSYVKNVLTISYILFIPDLIFAKLNCIDFMVYIVQNWRIISWDTP